MKVNVRYERKPGDTVNGEMIIITNIYSTFDTAEMDRYENILKEHIGSGVQYDMDLDQTLEPEK